MLSIVILSFNRRDSLRRTLGEVLSLGPARADDIIVVDNASTDGSCDMLRSEFPRVTLIPLTSNIGVDAYNIGARRARGRLLLVLDDDSWPDPAGLENAIALLESASSIAAVAMLPVHPSSKLAEWKHGTHARRGWPFMGCGNLVRVDDWKMVGGYDGSFFLYRNDCDLALRLLGAGRDVAFDPAWVVWHDSPGAAVKSERWLRLATRNWAWMARRHGRGLYKYIGMCAGIAWAARLAGLNLSRLWCVLRGACAGVFGRPAPLPSTVRPDGKAWRDLVRTQMRSRNK